MQLSYIAGGGAVPDPKRLLMRSVLRVVCVSMVLVAVPAALLTIGAHAALASGPARAVHADSATIAFGLLGPVGFGAVALGIVGMTAGVVRQRRKARTTTVPPESRVPDLTAMVDPVLSEEPTRQR